MTDPATVRWWPHMTCALSVYILAFLSGWQALYRQITFAINDASLPLTDQDLSDWILIAFVLTGLVIAFGRFWSRPFGNVAFTTIRRMGSGAALCLAGLALSHATLVIWNVIEFGPAAYASLGDRGWQAFTTYAILAIIVRLAANQLDKHYRRRHWS